MFRRLQRIELVLILLCALAAEAKSSSGATKISVHVRMGDKVSRFELSQTKQEGLIEFQNNQGQSRKTKLKPRDFKTVLEEHDKLPLGVKVPPLCYRNQMAVTKVDPNGRKTTRVACLVDRSPASKSFAKFANVLVLAL